MVLLRRKGLSRNTQLVSISRSGKNYDTNQQNQHTISDFYNIKQQSLQRHQRQFFQKRSCKLLIKYIVKKVWQSLPSDATFAWKNECILQCKKQNQCCISLQLIIKFFRSQYCFIIKRKKFYSIIKSNSVKLFKLHFSKILICWSS